VTKANKGFISTSATPCQRPFLPSFQPSALTTDEESTWIHHNLLLLSLDNHVKEII
jgi:hypothetical protein